MELFEMFDFLKINNYRLPKNKMEAKKWIAIVLTSLSSTDSQVRDKTAYEILCEWLVNKNNLTFEQKKQIYFYVSNKENLLVGIGKQEDDSVFQRSFLALTIALLLISNKKSDFLEEKEVMLLFDLTIQLLRNEKDTRSFVEGSGWAHSTAHTADALDEFVYQVSIKQQQVKVMLNGIDYFYKHTNTILTGEEDERLSTILISALQEQKIDLAEILIWLESFSKNIPKQLPEIKLINSKQFIQTLLIKLSILNYDVSFSAFPLLTRYLGNE